MNVYTHLNTRGETYYLHMQKVLLNNSSYEATNYYFAKTQGGNAIDYLPDGYQIIETTRTGLPMLKKVR